MQISPELRLLIHCSRSNFAGEQPDAPVESPVTWPKLLRLARFHRIEGLASRSVSMGRLAVPKQVSTALAAERAAIAADSLRDAAECQALIEMFERAAIPLLFLKGLTLGVVAYGPEPVKAGIDIDLLVPAECIARAAQLLRERRYECVIPASGTPIDRWHSIRKESLWESAREGFAVDLHTRLADNPRLIPSVGIGSARQLVDVGNGIVLPTLAPDELFAYLAVHGASSAWFRLKWISDFAAMLAGRTADEVTRLYRRSLELGAGRAPAQALLLSDRLFGTLERNPDLRAELLADRASRWLFEAAFRQLTAREAVEPTATRLGTLTMHWTQLLLLPGASFKLSEVARQARAALSSSG